MTIPSTACGPDVYVDKNFIAPHGFRRITINNTGQLVFLSDPGYELDVSAVVINSGGKFQVGNSECPVGLNTKTDVAELNFTQANPPLKNAVKGITVNSSGTLQMYGATGVALNSLPPGNPQAPSWTYLAVPAGPPDIFGIGQGVGAPVPSDGDTTVSVADFVDWQVGQWIVVAGTDFSPDSAEFVQIYSITCAGPATGPCTITLNPRTPLVNYHFGGVAPNPGAAAFGDGPQQNYGVDERAEVGLISRNVKLTSTITGTDIHRGGEIKILNGYKKVEIQGVEIEKFGKDRLGSYPIHFHKVGEALPSTLIDSNSIHHSYNHCITVHDTNGLTITNNVCARIVDHIFYLETGNESENTFRGNLGIGAMDNAFSIDPTNAAALRAFWSGDYLAQQNGYDGFNIPFTDKQGPALVYGSTNTPAGFWITNPGGNVFVGNSIAGCQDIGRGFWMLPTSSSIARIPLPKHNFDSNRAHGCYTGFDTAPGGIVHDPTSGYIPQQECVGGNDASKESSRCDAITEFDNLTATRNRDRGIWVRPGWYDIESPRLASNRDSVALVSSGGTEGSPPGEWSRVNNGILVGISTNNPNRFGPCPYNGQNGVNFGGPAGCYESQATAGNGYPDPKWNLFGVMFYDGPARIENTKFINFRVDPTTMLTFSDEEFLAYYGSAPSNQTMPCGSTLPFQYEGDAAMGWFQSNVNSYPPTQYTENLSYENVDLRHEIYTQDVENTCAGPGTPPQYANFQDGDKFTVILDHDASLSGLEVQPQGGGPVISGSFPISLNNLPFLSGPGTVDECQSLGAADSALEGRPTSLISPYNYATLEFSALTCHGSNPPCSNHNVMIFTKDQIDYPADGPAQIQFRDSAFYGVTSNNIYTIACGGTADPTSTGIPGHACVALNGRNGQGVYEPKLANGLGYTVGAQHGMPNLVTLMYGDANLPGGISSTNPFHTRVGICFRSEGDAAAPPATAFKVYKGSKSFAGPDNLVTTLKPYYEQLGCNGLDNKMCSSNPLCVETLCPSALFYSEKDGTPITSETRIALTSARSVTDLEDSSKCPDGTCYYYDQSSGLLFLNMVQERPNAGGPYTSPLGSCSGNQPTSDPACASENFYSCPGPGCELYTVEVSPQQYTPSGTPSDCTPYGGVGGATDYTQNYPGNLNQLAYASNNALVTTQLDGGTTPFPHQSASNTPTNFCPTNEPITPDWAPPSDPIPNQYFKINPPAGGTMTLTNVPPPLPVPGSTLYPLTPGTIVTVSATTPEQNCNANPPNFPDCSCEQSFTVTSTGWTSTGSNCCQLGDSGSPVNGIATISVQAAPYQCTGP